MLPRILLPETGGGYRTISRQGFRGCYDPVTAINELGLISQRANINIEENHSKALANQHV